jgi:hypothetical protein
MDRVCEPRKLSSGIVLALRARVFSLRYGYR